MSAGGNVLAAAEPFPYWWLPTEAPGPLPPPGSQYWLTEEGLLCLEMVATEAANVLGWNSSAADEAALALAADVGGPAGLLALAAHGSWEQQLSAAWLLRLLCSFGGQQFMASLEAAGAVPALLSLLRTHRSSSSGSAGIALCHLAYGSSSARTAVLASGCAEWLPSLFSSSHDDAVAAAAWLAQLPLSSHSCSFSVPAARTPENAGLEAIRQLVHLLDWMPSPPAALPALAALRHRLESSIADLRAATTRTALEERLHRLHRAADYSVGLSAFVRCCGLTVLNDYAWQPGDAEVQQQAASLLRSIAAELHWLQAEKESGQHRQLITALCHLLPASRQPAECEDPAEVAQRWASAQAAVAAAEAELAHELRALGLQAGATGLVRVDTGPKRCNELREKYGCMEAEVRQHAAAALVRLAIGEQPSPGVQEAAAQGAPGLAHLLTSTEGAAQTQAAQLLVALAGDSHADNRLRQRHIGLTLVQAGAASALAGLLGSRSLETAEHAVQLLHLVCCEEPRRVGAAGSIPALVCLLLRTYAAANELSPGSQCLPAKVCRTLCILAEHYPPYCAAIVAVGAVPAVEHMAAAGVLEAGWLLKELRQPAPAPASDLSSSRGAPQSQASTRGWLQLLRSCCAASSPVAGCSPAGEEAPAPAKSECRVCSRAVPTAQGMVLTPCGHHPTCVACTAELLAQGMRCPACRTEIESAAPSYVRTFSC